MNSSLTFTFVALLVKAPYLEKKRGGEKMKLGMGAGLHVNYDRFLFYWRQEAHSDPQDDTAVAAIRLKQSETLVYEHPPRWACYQMLNGTMWNHLHMYRSACLVLVEHKALYIACLIHPVTIILILLYYLLSLTCMETLDWDEWKPIRSCKVVNYSKNLHTA